MCRTVQPLWQACTQQYINSLDCYPFNRMKKNWDEHNLQISRTSVISPAVFNQLNTQSRAGNQSLACRTATVDNTKLPKTIPFSELPDSTGDSNDKLLDTHVREDNNKDAAISKYDQHGFLDLPSLLDGIDFNFEINGNNEMEWPFDNSPVFNDSNIFNDTENPKSSQSVASRTATVDNTKLPKTIPFSELPDSTGDSNDKLLNTPVREDNNTDAAISEYYPHTFQDSPSLLNGIDFNFEINGNNEMEWPFDNSSLFNDCNIFSDTESAKWSPFFPPYDFNPETYLNSEQEFLPTMNDQYAPQNKKHIDEVNSDSNTQKQFQTKRGSNVHDYSNVLTPLNSFAQYFQQSINGRCVESSPDPQMQSGTFEEIAGFYTDNLMQPFLVSTFGMQPFEHSSAPSSVAQNTTEGTFQNETYADEAYKDRDDQKQLTKSGISKIQEANEQNIESAPDRQIHNNKSEEVADCSTDNGTQTTQSTSESRMGVLPEKNGEKTLHVCFQCGQAFQNVSILCRHINQCLKSYEENRHESIMDDVRDQVNESAMAASCSQAVHEPRKTQDKFPWKTCNLCGKQFVSNSSLAIHYRSHTKETPYMCDICGRRFTTNFSKNRHRKRCTFGLTSLFSSHNSTVNLEDDILH
ncbi:Myoneurin [Trichinella nativa]|uniref:Myoneurin n=1 Tax=Trichinella nativa TaxID=6335 RepID=A0A0V1LFS9_9BILA|nr:Myoneurin [Trichinella nativa]